VASLRPSTSLAASSALPHEQVRLRCASLRVNRRCLADTSTPFMRQTTGGHNRPNMNLSDTQIEELENALSQLEQLDPASLPEPAAELAELLSRILDELEAK